MSTRRGARRTGRARFLGVAVAGSLVAVAVTASCGSSASAPSAGRTELTVSAAASLTGPFTELAHRYQSEHRGVRVTLNFGGSAQLAQQIASGAPVDVFAAASPATMHQAQAGGRVRGEPEVFTRNVLQIAVPHGNPAGVRGLADFARGELRLAVCLEQVPCGAAATQVFAAAGVRARPDTYEEDVRSVLTKVELGEVDAGLVYRTDVRAAAGKVDGVEFPESGKAVNDYLITAVSDSPDAARFVQFVRSDVGRQILLRAGFQAP